MGTNDEDILYTGLDDNILDYGEPEEKYILGYGEEQQVSSQSMYERKQNDINGMGYLEYQKHIMGGMEDSPPYNLLKSNRYLAKVEKIRGQAGGHNDQLLQQGILSLDSDIVITYSWGYEPHGVCGHVFEAYELYRTLKDLDPLNKTKITLLYADGTPPQKILKSIFNKYKGSKNELEDLERDILFVARPKCIKLRSTPLPYTQGYIPSNIVFCDGHVPGGASGEYLFKADIIHLQLCAKNSGRFRDVEFNEEIFNTHIDNIGYYLLYADQRLRMKPFTNDRAWLYDSIKTMRFDLLNQRVKQNYSKEHRYLVYMTPHDRSITKETGLQEDNQKNITLDADQSKDFIDGIFDILEQIPPKPKHQNELLICGPQRKSYILTDVNGVHTAPCGIEEIFRANIMQFQRRQGYENYWEKLEIKIIHEDKLPVSNIFDRFDTYIYTPTPKSWDCSSRFIPECKFYKKDVLLTRRAEYQLYPEDCEVYDDPKTDYGLRTRLFDTYSNMDNIRETKNNPKSKLILNLIHQWQDESRLPNFEKDETKQRFLQMDKIHLNKLEMFKVIRYRNKLYPLNNKIQKVLIKPDIK